jgi:hypothetical protein
LEEFEVLRWLEVEGHTVSKTSINCSKPERHLIEKSYDRKKKEAYMFIALFAILLLAWLGGFLVFHVSGALIHILLVLAVISLIAHFFRRQTVS